MMAGWTTPQDLKSQLLKLWERGDILREVLQTGSVFPLRLSLKGPGSAELTEHFEAVRDWAAQLAIMPQIRIVWRELRHRVQGQQRLPEQVWIDTLEGALTLLAKGRDAERFRKIIALTPPALLPWLARRPLQALELADSWQKLLEIVAWLCAHPRPGIYLRQVDIPGVHSKFIESHRAVLAELFDLVLEPQAIAENSTGVSQFQARYGFLQKPLTIRFRVLDEKIRLLPGVVLPDISLDADSFAKLDMQCSSVYITENEINFLAFPKLPNAIVIFGKGYGWSALAKAQWLSACRIHYWGDIDTHGFAILDQLRAHFGHVISFLMDRETLDAHELHWGTEPDQVRHDLTRLNVKEQALYDALRDNRIRKNLRLEQERVGFGWLSASLAAHESV
jgi:hypothetical protein